MSQNFPRDNSGPGSLHQVMLRRVHDDDFSAMQPWAWQIEIKSPKLQATDDETFDKEFDKVFQNEKEKLPNLNPSSASVGEIDQERKTSYFRSVSQDETGGAEERPTASGDDGSEPLQGKHLKIVPASRLCVCPFLCFINT